MASEDALRSTNEKANFQRLTRLLMLGGVTLLRETFDSICPPGHLPIKLSHPAVQAQLRGARLTRSEWNCLNPSPGVYGKSTDFDITLIFKLLRTICSLTPPPSGWDNMPSNTNHSLEADLARVKYYRNEVYGHSQTMEITDAEFVVLWREISEALLRIAAGISHVKRDEWKKSIDAFKQHAAPLTPEEERCVEDLQQWYKQDMDVKDELEKLRATYQDGITTLNENIQGRLEKLLEELQALRENVKQNGSAVQVSDCTFRNPLLRHTLKGTYATVENNDDRGKLPKEDQNSFIENQITELFRQLRTVNLNTQDAFLRWSATRRDTVKQLEVLNTNHLKNKMRVLTGTSVSMAGILSTLAGVVAAPFTAGVGMAFSLAGSVATLGGLVHVATTSCRTERPPLESGHNEEVQQAIQKDREACSELQKHFYILEYLISQLAEFIKPLQADPMLLRLLEGSGFDFLREREIFEDGARFFPGATTTPRILASAAVCSFIIAELLPLITWMFFKFDLELHRGSTSPKVEYVRRFMTELESLNKEEIKCLVESFIDKKFTEACCKTDCDKQRENQAGDAEDADDDYVQYDDETSRATAERQRLLPKGS